ncbi:ARM repeat protein interacting with ABF2-like protein [Tanacetum coccineum]
MADDKQINTVRRSLKRKLEDSFIVIDSSLSSDEEDSSSSQQQRQEDLLIEIRELIEVLETNSSDRALTKRSIQILSELAKNEDNVNLLLGCGIVPALVKHLQEPQWPNEAVIGFDEFATCSRPLEYEAEKASAFTIGLLAIKVIEALCSNEPEHQHLIVDAGALPHLVALLKRHRDNRNSRAVNGVIRKAADAITNLAHENGSVKTRVRVEGGIPPLVELLESSDAKVQRAAAGALRTLAFKNDENKTQIVDHNALPTLVLMLQSEDTGIHYEAVGVIGNLVHSSPKIKMDVLQAGALQPVIKLLSSTCSESQREAALLLGQFAAADTDSKVHIVQRGAVGPLLEMLKSPEAQLREMSAFALGRLAQDTHNQAGIAHSGGIVPLLKLLDSRNGTLQHNGAFTLYGLADNEDNVADLISLGGVQKLMDGEFIVQPTRDCVAKTLKRMEDKIHGRVLNCLLYKMHNADKIVQRRIVLALAHLCLPEDQEAVFVDNNGLDLLLELLQSVHLKHQGDACAALCRLAEKATSVSPVDAGPSSPISQVYLGEDYVNNPMVSDVTFIVEGKRFYAHRIGLLSSSDAFRAMFDGGYKERDAKDVQIPNIRWETFELMMRFIYTGSVEVNMGIAQDLLKAADQYLLDGLKRLCEYTMARDINADNLALMYDLSETYNAVSLRNACILFVLEQFDRLHSELWYGSFVLQILPEIRNYFMTTLTKPMEVNSQQ